MRWWTSWRTAEPVVKSVTRENGVDGVGTALLGLHALGADVLAGLSRQTCVDPELVAESLASVDVGPVAKAWSDAVMPGTDYGWLRVGPIKREADIAAVRVVTSLVSKGVAWPLALERAAAAYGLPGKDALVFAQQVSAPVVNPMVLADAADERLALHAVQVCKAESDAPVEFSKDDDWVEIKRGNRVYRQQVNRDDQGQFASAAESEVEAEIVSEAESEEAQYRAVAARRKKKRQQRLRGVAAQRRAQAEESARIQARISEQARARREGAAAPGIAQAQSEAAVLERVKQKAQLRVADRDARRVRERANQRIAQRAYQRKLDQRAVAEAVKARSKQKMSETPQDWVLAGVQNWPLVSEAATWAGVQDPLEGSLQEPPLQWQRNSPLMKRTLPDGEQIAVYPVLSVTPDGMKILDAAAQDADPENRYVDLFALEAAERYTGKNLYSVRLVPEGTPKLELTHDSDKIWVNVPLRGLYERPGFSIVSDAVKNAERWIDDNDWQFVSESQNPYMFQRIKLPSYKMDMAYAAVKNWNDIAADPVMTQTLDRALARYNIGVLRDMATVIGMLESDGVPLSANDMNVPEETVKSMVDMGLLDTERLHGSQAASTGMPAETRYVLSSNESEFHTLLSAMNSKVGLETPSFDVELTPFERVQELNDEMIGLPAPMLVANMPVAQTDVDHTATRTPPWPT